MRVSTSWGMPVFTAACAATLVAGAGMTITEIGPWYHSLKQPGWAPPDWAFGVIWTTVFFLIACSGATSWMRAPGGRAAEILLGLFALNGFLNLLWSFLFFRLHRPDWALIEVVALWLSILVLIVISWRSSRSAAFLLIPYLVWVSIAAVLNYQVVMLNAPF